MSTQTVALAFVELYYQVLTMFIDQTYKFYKEESSLSWALPNGETKSATSSEGINEFFMTPSHFNGNKVEIITIDSQLSIAGGIHVIVTACLIEQDKSRKNFCQSFLLAPQEKGYYVLNDMFRFIGVEKSSTIVAEKVDENVSIPPLAIVSKDEDAIEENSDKPETKVITTTENLRIVANDGLLATPEIPQVVDDIQYKSIHIAGLPKNTTRSDLYAIVKEFGPVTIHDVQVKIYENGYCCGFVHFEDEASARNAVRTRRIVVRGREVPITYKRLNKGRVERANSSLDRGGFRSGTGGYHELRGQPQYFDGHRRGGGYLQQKYYRRRNTN